MIASLKKKTRRKRKKSIKHIKGVCSACGKKHRLTVNAWREARWHDYWPACFKCGERVYPTKRACRVCNAVLRSGNFGDLCAVCERKVALDPLADLSTH